MRFALQIFSWKLTSYAHSCRDYDWSKMPVTSFCSIIFLMSRNLEIGMTSLAVSKACRWWSAATLRKHFQACLPPTKNLLKQINLMLVFLLPMRTPQCFNLPGTNRLSQELSGGGGPLVLRLGPKPSCWSLLEVAISVSGLLLRISRPLKRFDRES